MKYSTKDIRERLLEAAVGYQLPEGMQDLIEHVADRLELPKSRVALIAYSMDGLYVPDYDPVDSFE